VQALIRAGQVHVNGRVGRASTRLRAGDRVEVELPPASAPAGGLRAEALPLAIVHEDEAILVIDKPAGQVVHPGAGAERGTLAHALLHHHPAIAAVGGPDRPGIVHRLDKDTSGLLVVAKTPRAYRALVEAMRRREVGRRYLALVWGSPRADAGTVDAAVGRDPRNRKRMAALVPRGGGHRAERGRPARTHWRVLRRYGLASLLELRLETGRTHQIRVHLAHLHHPVVGDPVYGGRPKKQLSPDPRQRSLAMALLDRLPRQALHAAELTLSHPVTGGPLRFESPVPPDIARALEWLDNEAGGRHG
jgi:23S rRNA pseudouridine1911/1915/1917 synthase